MDSLSSSFYGAVLLAVSCGVLLLLMLRAPYRLFNSFLLLFTLFLAIAESFLLSADGNLPIVILLLLSFLLLFAPLLLIWNGVMMLKRESGKLANILSLLLGVVIAAGEISFFVFFSGGLSAVAEGKLAPLFAFCGLSVLYFSLLLLAFVLYMLVLPWVSHGKKYDVILVHGCALIHGDQVSRILAARLDMAARVFTRGGGHAVLILSGGQGDDETVTEAEAMRRYLLSHAIPENKMRLEDQSHTTEENLLFSRKLMEREGLGGRLALVSSNYHLYRCLLTAKELGMRASGFGGRVAAYYWPSAVIREFAAIYTRKRYLVAAILGYWLFVLIPVLLYLFTII